MKQMAMQNCLTKKINSTASASFRGARHTVVNASGFTSQMRPAKRALQDDTNSWNPIPDALSLAAQAIR